MATFWASEGHPLVDRLELSWPGRAAEILRRFDGQEPPRVVPGVPEVLDELLGRGLRLAVVSSRRLPPLLRGLAAGGLEDRFPVVIGLETVHRPKPDPEGMLLAAERLEIPPSRVLVVGDRAVDMEAARRAGATGWPAAWCLPEGAEPMPCALTTPAEVLLRLDGPAEPA